jgi:hypothetical protein
MMGIRAIYGFKNNNKYKVSWRASDGYLEGLGKEIIEALQHVSILELNEIFAKIQMIDENINPTKEQIKKYNKYKNKFYADHLKLRKEPMSWFSLLDLASGKFRRYIEGLDIMVDGYDYMVEGEDWEYKYIIDLNDNTLNIYNSKPYIDDNGKKDITRICRIELNNIASYVNIAKILPTNQIKNA